MPITIIGVLSILILCMFDLDKIAQKKEREYEIKHAKEEGYEVYFCD